MARSLSVRPAAIGAVVVVVLFLIGTESAQADYDYTSATFNFCGYWAEADSYGAHQGGFVSGGHDSCAYYIAQAAYFWDGSQWHDDDTDWNTGDGDPFYQLSGDITNVYGYTQIRTPPQNYSPTIEAHAQE